MMEPRRTQGASSEVVRDINRRIVEWRRIPVGPPIHVRLVNADDLVAHWRTAQGARPAIGGADKITTGDGNDVVVGGPGADTIDAGGGDNVVFGDSAKLTFDNSGAVASGSSLGTPLGRLTVACNGLVNFGINNDDTAVYDVDSGAVTSMTHHTGTCLIPSPDRKKYAFYQQDGIYVIAAGSGKATKVSRTM